MKCFSDCLDLFKREKNDEKLPRKISSLRKTISMINMKHLKRLSLADSTKKPTRLSCKEDIKSFLSVQLSSNSHTPSSNMQTPIKKIVIKDKLRCFFCRGVKCKYENYLKNPNPAIKGLNSDYITDFIIASQRPSTVLINKFDIIEQFKSENIELVVNLQIEGEHPFCGPNGGLEKNCNFTYNYKDFTSNDIKVNLSGWIDISTPDNYQFILKIVKDMAVTIKENKNKVFVHCHAGNSRTGMLIGCYLLFEDNCDAKDVITYIRAKRKGCIEKDSHRNFIYKFDAMIKKARRVFTPQKMEVEEIIKNQNDLNYGIEYSKYEHIPKIIVVVLEKFLELKQEKKLTYKDTFESLLYPKIWGDKQEEKLYLLKSEINKNDWNSIKYITDPNVLSQLLYDWLEDCVVCVIKIEKIDLLYDYFKNKNMNMNKDNSSSSLEKFVNNPQAYTKEETKTILKTMQGIFSQIEFETLNCVASFINNYKQLNSELRDECKIMLQKICIHLLAFTANEIYMKDSNDIKFQFSIFYVNNLVAVINFLSAAKNIDYGEGPLIHNYSTYIYNNFKNSYQDNIINNYLATENGGETKFYQQFCGILDKHYKDQVNWRKKRGSFLGSIYENSNRKMMSSDSEMQCNNISTNSDFNDKGFVISEDNTTKSQNNTKFNFLEVMKKSKISKVLQNENQVENTDTSAVDSGNTISNGRRSSGLGLVNLKRRLSKFDPGKVPINTVKRKSEIIPSSGYVVKVNYLQ